MKLPQINKSSGFTLVELLIVITILAILSVAGMVALDPIEKVNRARDVALQENAAQVISAFDSLVTSSGSSTSLAAYFNNAANQASTTQMQAFINTLISNNELKTSVRKSELYLQSLNGSYGYSMTVANDSLTISFKPQSKDMQRRCGGTHCALP